MTDGTFRRKSRADLTMLATVYLVRGRIAILLIAAALLGAMGGFAVYTLMAATDFRVELGNVGEWIAGLGATAAVAVALYQAALARQGAEASERGAALQIEQADSRLYRELDQSRRRDQANAVAHAFEEFGRLLPRTIDLVAEFDIYSDALEDSGSTGGEVFPRQELDDRLMEWNNQYHRVTSSAQVAQMIVVTPPDIALLLARYAQRVKDLHGVTTNTGQSTIDGERPDTSQIHVLIDEIGELTEEITVKVRYHLAERLEVSNPQADGLPQKQPESNGKVAELEQRSGATKPPEPNGSK